MKKILVPVDFSPHTENSCRFALGLASKERSELILFHSFFENIYFSDGGFVTGFESGIMLSDEMIRAHYEQKMKSLEELASKIASDAGSLGITDLETRCLLESGDPEIRILSVIDKEKPDLIIMGSSGMGKKSLFSGSVARKIMEKTEVPVIAIPGAELPPVIRNIAYMTNFDPADRHAIPEIEQIFAPLQVNIHCIHLRHERGAAETSLELSKLAEMDELKPLKGRIFFESPDAEDMKETLESIIRNKSIDLIAFIPHRRNVFKNIIYQGLTKEDLFQAEKPVMAIPSPQQP